MIKIYKFLNLYTALLSNHHKHIQLYYMNRSTILLSLTMIFTLFTSSIINAQSQRPDQKERPSIEERVERNTNKLAKKLKLSKEQTAQVYQIHLEAAQKREAQRKLKKAEREEAIAQHEAAIKQVLTPEQFEEYQKMAKKRKNKRKEKAMKHKEKRKEKMKEKGIE